MTQRSMLRRLALPLLFALAISSATAQNLSWKLLGAFSGMDTYTSLETAPGGRLYVLAATVLYMSTDFGSSWSLRKVPAKENVALCADLQGRLYMQTVAIAGSDHRLWRSLDYGWTWELVEPLPVFSWVRTMIVDPGTGELVVAGSQGLYTSNDGGTNWTKIDTLSTVEHLTTGPDGTWYASTSTRLWRSSSSARTVWEIDRDFAAPITLMSNDAAGSPMLVADSIYRYLSATGRWRSSRGGLADSTSITAIISHSASDLFAVDTDGWLYHSTDAGTSWGRVDEYLPDFTINDAAITASGDLLVATVAGVWRSSDDGEHWKESSAGLDDHNTVEVIRQGKHDELLLVLNSGRIMRSIDNGVRWNLMTVGRTDRRYRDVIRTSRGDLLARAHDEGTGHDLLYRSGDDGIHWDTVHVAERAERYHIHHLLPYRDKLYAWGTCVDSQRVNLLLRSSDDGLSWSTTARSPFTQPLDVTDIAIDSASVIYVVDPKGAARTTDEGATWTTYTGLGITQLVAAPYDILYGSYPESASIRRSTDGGNLWEYFPGELFGDPGHSAGLISCLALYRGRMLFARSSAVGAVLSTDYGETWLAVNNGLTGKSITTFTIDKDDIMLVGAGAGIYRLQTMIGSSVDQSSSQKNLQVCMDGNRMRVSMVTGLHGEIALYDLLGSRVRVLASGDVSSGEHAFDIGGITSGSYFLRASLAGQVISLPIALTR